MRTFWLSFCDGKRPAGEQFLGACLVDVTQAEASQALIEIAFSFPDALHGSEWVAAATRKAHREGCNPGGEIASADVTDGPPEMLSLYPRNRLMSKAELEAIAPVMAMDEVERWVAESDGETMTDEELKDEVERWVANPDGNTDWEQAVYVRFLAILAELDALKAQVEELTYRERMVDKLMKDEP